MENYQLKADEVILYKGKVNVLPDGKPEKQSAFKTTETEIVLTNYNIVLSVVVNKLFRKSMDTFVYEVSTIKTYQEVPQVLQKGAYVDIYLTAKELFLQFPNKKQATSFINAALRLLTGFSKLVRGVKKTQKAVKETEDALGVDITGTAKTVVSVAADMAITASGASTAKKGTKAIGFIAKAFKGKEKEKEPKQLPPVNQVKKLKELKKLLDNGTITQEEFDKMKQQYVD